MTERIAVTCEPRAFDYECRVLVGEGDRATEHHVSVSRAELKRLAPAHSEPTALVEESFRFLLEREPSNSILRRFAITDIGRYFPEYRAEIKRRV